MSSANTAQADAAQTERRSPRPARRSRMGRRSTCRPAPTCSTRSATRSSRARTSSVGCSRARKARRCPKASGEVVRAGHIFKFFAGEVLRRTGEMVPSVRPASTSKITREPVGVVGIISPWNFPIAIPAWKIAPALAYGNCVVFKPADLVPGSRLGARRNHLRAPACPAGVFNLVMGRGSRGRRGAASTTRASTRSASPARWRPGSKIAQKAVARMAKFQLEMGGKNPLVVLDDADLGDRGERARCNGAFFSTGQRCTASSRLIVTEGIHDRFVAALTERIKATLKVDNALTAGHARWARWWTRPQLNQDLEYIEIGQEGRREARVRRRAAEARDRGLLPRAGAVHRGAPTPCASIARRDLRAGRLRDPREGLRRGARARQRHAVRPVVRHRHDVAQARVALQAPRAGRHGDGQPADRRRRLSRAVRRPQGRRATARASRGATRRSSTRR